MSDQKEISTCTGDWPTGTAKLTGGDWPQGLSVRMHQEAKLCLNNETPGEGRH